MPQFSRPWSTTKVLPLIVYMYFDLASSQQILQQTIKSILQFNRSQQYYLVYKMPIQNNLFGVEHCLLMEAQ